MSLPPDVLGTTSTLIRVLQDNGCAGADPVTVHAFQETFNAHYSPQIGVDGKYGRETEGAVSHVILDANADDDGVYGMNAPSACSYHTATPATPPPATAPRSSPATATPVSQASMAGSMFQSPWTWAVLLAGGAAVAISRSKHPPKWARKMGLHR
jgi:hypothetical protein